MEPNDVMAALAESAHDDAVRYQKKLGERLGGFAGIRDAMGEDDADPSGELEIFHVGELLSYIEVGSGYVVRNLIPKNSLMLFTGKPKFGKSLGALDMAVSIATNTPVWGTLGVDEPGPVIYLAMEDGRQEVTKRFRSYLSVSDPRPEDPPFDRENTALPPVHVCINRFNLAEDAGIEKLERSIHRIKPSLVIVDTAREALNIRKWEDPGEVSDKFRPLRELARRTCAILVVAHNRKADAENAVDEIGGTNAVTSSVDGWISARTKQDFRDDDDDPRRRLTRRRLSLEVDGRGDVSGSYMVEVNFSNLHFRLVSEEEQEQNHSIGTQAKTVDKLRPIASAITALGIEADADNILARTGLDKTTVYRLLTLGMDNKMFDFTERPSPVTNRRRKVYSLVEGVFSNSQVPTTLYKSGNWELGITAPPQKPVPKPAPTPPPIKPVSVPASEPDVDIFGDGGQTPPAVNAEAIAALSWHTTVMGGSPTQVARFAFMGDEQEGYGNTRRDALDNLLEVAGVNCPMDSDPARGPLFLRAVTDAVDTARRAVSNG